MSGVDPVHPVPIPTGPGQTGPHYGGPLYGGHGQVVPGYVTPGHVGSGQFAGHAPPLPHTPEHPTGMSTPIADGPRPGNGGVLPALQAALREGLELLPLETVVRRIEAFPQLGPALPADAQARRAHLAAGVGWLIDHLDQPQLVATRVAELGPGLAALGLPHARLEMLSAAILEAMRAGMGNPAMTPHHHDAWRLTGELTVRWIGQGAQAGAYEPPYWTGVVHAVDPPIALIRTLLAYPHRVGQYAIVEPAHYPGTWLPYWIANPPAGDNLVELHIPDVPVELGDLLRLRAPLVGLLEPGPGPLLLVAEETGVSAVKAILGEQRRRVSTDPTHLYWLAEEHYDASLADLATVVPVTGDATALADAVAVGGPWVDHEICVIGPPETVLVVLERLAARGIDTTRVRVAAHLDRTLDPATGPETL